MTEETLVRLRLKKERDDRFFGNVSRARANPEGYKQLDEFDLRAMKGTKSTPYAIVLRNGIICKSATYANAKTNECRMTVYDTGRLYFDASEEIDGMFPVAYNPIVTWVDGKAEVLEITLRDATIHIFELHPSTLNVIPIYTFKLKDFTSKEEL